MHDSGFKRWMVWGALASASWLVAACGVLPQSGDTYVVAPGFTRSPELTGYNGTIKDIPTSIDPRTAEAKGTPGRSLLLDPGEQALLESQGAMGGSGSTPPAPGPEGGPQSEERGTEGSTIAPTNPNAPGGAPAKQDSRGK